MVCIAAERGKLSGESSMAVAPERTTTETAAGKPLHNFDMPWLRWGSQKYLRCMKVSNSGAGNETRRRSEGLGSEFRPIASERCESTAAVRKKRRRNNVRVGDDEEEEEEEEEGDGIAAVREKLLGDLKFAAEQMKVEIFRDGVAVESDGAAALTAAAEEEVEIEARPWNLRTRRAACKAPVDDRKIASSSSSPEKTVAKQKREKFSLGLLKKEIETDFMALVGHKPARRPKKRSKHVQRQLDFLLPGNFLTEITAETYKVSENPETKR